MQYLTRSTNFFNGLLLSICKRGFIFFNIGIFLLASAPLISSLFLLISIGISTFKREDKYLEDKWNYPLIIVSVLMIVSCCSTSFFRKDFLLEGWDPILSWISLINWIPLFICFWGFQPYLLTQESRRKSGLLFICGSIPILISGFGQYLFNWHGPFEAFNGLIIWFQRPIALGEGLTGLFNNANYAGCMLGVVLPFSLAALFQPKQNSFKKLISFLISFLIIIAILLTNSRNAWAGFLITLPILLSSSRYMFTLFILTIACLVISLFGQFHYLLPDKLIQNFDFYNLTQDHRWNLWINAIDYIIKRPLLGSGAASFPLLITADYGTFFGHAHNLPLEIAVSYGVLPSIILSLTIIFLLFTSYRKVFFYNKRIRKPDIFEKAWISAAIVITFSHMLDITYYDIRISLASWIFFAGLKGIISDKSYSI